MQILHSMKKMLVPKNGNLSLDLITQQNPLVYFFYMLNPPLVIWPSLGTKWPWQEYWYGPSPGHIQGEYGHIYTQHQWRWGGIMRNVGLPWSVHFYVVCLWFNFYSWLFCYSFFSPYFSYFPTFLLLNKKQKNLKTSILSPSNLCNFRATVSYKLFLPILCSCCQVVVWPMWTDDKAESDRCSLHWGNNFAITLNLGSFSCSKYTYLPFM